MKNIVKIIMLLHLKINKKKKEIQLIPENYVTCLIENSIEIKNKDSGYWLLLKSQIAPNRCGQEMGQMWGLFFGHSFPSWDQNGFLVSSMDQWKEEELAWYGCQTWLMHGNAYEECQSPPDSSLGIEQLVLATSDDGEECSTEFVDSSFLKTQNGEREREREKKKISTTRDKSDTKKKFDLRWLIIKFFFNGS